MEKGSFPSPTTSSYSYISKFSNGSAKECQLNPSIGKSYSSALPGRVRRRKYSSRSSGIPDAHSISVNLIKNLHRMIRNRFVTRWKVHLVVLSWYIIGCISIATTKILLRDFGVQPLNLTCQQLFIGGCSLHSFISLNIFGTSTTPSWKLNDFWYRPRKITPAVRYLVFTAISFALGFYTTNLSFFGSHASFVETIKAAEPITSASVAYVWGIEGLSRQEVFSLLGMCGGVVVSTVGNALLASSPASKSLSQGAATTLSDSFVSTSIVLVSNLCFSFRGLFQKLLRACPEGSIALLDDIHLQLRIQQLGFMMLISPVIFLDGKKLFHKLIYLMGLSDSSSLQYIGLSVINGIAFATYNLASTYVLSQLPVVQHAAINSIRRLFAIVVTSIIFSIPLTAISLIGIAASLIGFITYTHFKTKRLRQPRPLSSLLPLNAED